MKLIMILSLVFATSQAIAKTVPLDTKESVINWKGSKKVVKDNHVGTVKVKSGSITIDEKNMVKSGKIIIDMTTIDSTDQKGEWKKKLDGHLKGADFFDVANHKEAMFEFNEVIPSGRNSYKLNGTLTIKDKPNKESITLTISNDTKNKVMSAEGKFSFDRNKYDVTYNSEASVLKKTISIPTDRIIQDKIELTFKLKTQKI